MTLTQLLREQWYLGICWRSVLHYYMNGALVNRTIRRQATNPTHSNRLRLLYKLYNTWGKMPLRVNLVQAGARECMGLHNGHLIQYNYIHIYTQWYACPSLLTSGVISYSDPTLGDGTVATNTCNIGYTLTGGSTMTCGSDGVRVEWVNSNLSMYMSLFSQYPNLLHVPPTIHIHQALIKFNYAFFPTHYSILEKCAYQIS